MSQTNRITYKAGLMEPSDDYIPEVTRPKPAWITTNRLSNCGPLAEDNLIPSHSIDEPRYLLQKMQYTKIFPSSDSTTETIRDKNEFDPVDEGHHHSKPPILSSQRDPLHFRLVL